MVFGGRGMARRNRRLRRYRAAGKTGTAQTHRFVDGKEVNAAWFAGYAPHDAPPGAKRVAFAVYIEDTYAAGGSIAAPVAGKLLAAVARHPEYAASFGR